MSQAESAVAKLCTIIIETVHDCDENQGHGMPCGPMYAAFMSACPNLTAAQFNQLVALACATGKVRRSGHVLYAVK